MKYVLKFDDSVDFIYANSHTFEDWKKILHDFFRSKYTGSEDQFNAYLVNQLRNCLIPSET